MATLDVINVGQGDCMVIRPTDACMHAHKDIFVDLGPGNVDVSKYIYHDNVAIFITHHHSDHLDGLRYFYNDFNKISEIILPYYQNEISLIAQAILKLKGFATAKNCSYFKNLLQTIVDNQQFLTHIHRKGGGPRLSFAYEGKRYCKHIKVLNPPLIPQCENGVRDMPLEALGRTFHELFDSDFADNLTRYVHYTQEGSLYDDPLSVNFLRIQPENNDAETAKGKVNVVLNFIVKNVAAMRAFNANPIQSKLKIVYDKYIACTHDCCTVLKMSYNDATFLLTSDASKKVFNRLIQEKRHDLHADYLKMPHHGSKGNINNKILNAIQPKVAIISHDNGLFGCAKDPHPNQEVLNMLKTNRITVLVTNDVVKKGKPVIKKSNNKNDRNVTVIG